MVDFDLGISIGGGGWILEVVIFVLLVELTGCGSVPGTVLAPVVFVQG